MFSYMGLWFIQGRYDYASTPELADCMTSVYRKTSWGHADITERSKILTTNTPHQINSLMIFDNPTRGHYTYEIPSDNVADWPVNILSTDYISYSIEWSCFPNGTSVDTYIWVLSRLRYVDNLFNARISKILRSHNIDESSIRKINQNQALCS
ncbi:lazarillo protein-like isoform X2 [Bradysia coprophila]|nr:lazarillo protein-like isoform X2 [Bradysia coprophila]